MVASDIGSRNLEKVLSEHYQVPSYQRVYEWKPNRVNDLWIDLMSEYVENPQNRHSDYLLGPLVIDASHHNTTDHDYFEIIDGQQRLVTISLMLCALRDLVNQRTKNVQDETSKEVTNQFIEFINGFIISDEDGIMVLGDNKNRDRDVFREILFPNSEPKISKALKESHSYKSNKLRRNYRSLRVNLVGLCDACGLTVDCVNITRAILLLRTIIQDLISHVYFAHVKINDPKSVHQVFTSLNAKGQSLQQGALIKSYILKSANDEKTKRQLQIRWDRLMTMHNEAEDKFLYESYLSRLKEKEKSASKLYETISEQLDGQKSKSKRYLEKYIRELEVDSPFIQMLDNPRLNPIGMPTKLHHTFYGIDQIGAKYIRRPIIAVCREWGSKDNLNDHRIQDLTDCFLKVFFMYKTVGNRSIDVVRGISRSVTQGINKEPVDLSNVFSIILDNPEIKIYLEDDAFNKDFPRYVENLDNNFAKYILMSLEHELNKPQGVSLNLNRPETELEHIFPQNADPKDWPNEENLGKHTNRLGNLKLNGDNDGDESYKTSGYKLNKNYLSKYKDWNEESILQREKELLEIAKRIWDLKYYRTKYLKNKHQK